MKIPFVLTLCYLFTAVWAGGYQNCLERVWAFEAFLIDQHNPAADQQIGFRCSRWRAGACIGTWDLCRPGRATGRTQCNFDDMQAWMGNTIPGMNMNQAAYQAGGRLDQRETAKNCLWAWRNAGRSPYNFRGYKVLRNGLDDHNDFIRRIGQITNDNYKKPAVRTAAGDEAFRRTDFTLNLITEARVADHGRHLITAAQGGLNGLTIEERNMGANPFYRAGWTPPAGVQPDTPDWRTVDWESTINNSADPPATRGRVRTWLDGFYRGPTANANARDHWQVLRSYKNTKDKTNRCRK